MGKPMILVSSVTYAMKAREFLFRHGIKAYVERASRTSERVGCGYGVVVPQRIDEAERILKDAGFRVMGRGEGTGQE